MVQSRAPRPLRARRRAEVATDSRARELRRMEILRAAAEVFRRKGFHAAGMREIASAVGMQPGALYYYFASKEDLLQGCQEISLSRLTGSAEAIVATGASPDQKLRQLVQAHLELTLDVLGGSAAHVEFRALPAEKFARIVKGRDRYEAIWMRVIQAGIATGAFRKVDARLAVFALFGALNWTVVWWRPQGRLKGPDLGAGFVDIFLAGLRRTPSGSSVETDGGEA